jgi:SAM-dependent methyltransferase
MTDKVIHNIEDILRMLDSFLPNKDEWWDGFYSDRERKCPFFIEFPDENLVSYFDNGLMKPGWVLELGCGSGRNAIYFAQKGCKVDAVDFSKEAIIWATERAKEKATEVNFICRSVFDLDVDHSAYDIIYDSGCFHHIPPHRRLAYMQLILHSLKEAGILGLTCFTPEGGSSLSDWDVYKERSLKGGIGYSEKRLRDIFEKSFNILEFRRMKEMKPEDSLFGKSFLWAILMQPKAMSGW